MVYLAQSRSLAILEMLVHLDSPALLDSYVLIEVEFDSSLITGLDQSCLPRNWRDDPAPQAVQRIGDEWASGGTSAVLTVPSVLVPDESNFLLNPRHPDFGKIRISRPQSFRLDARLVGKR